MDKIQHITIHRGDLVCFCKTEQNHEDYEGATLDGQVVNVVGKLAGELEEPGG